MAVELVTTSAERSSTPDYVIPGVVHQHARLLYQTMVLSHEEFNRVLYSSQPIDVAYLVNTAKLLNNLNVIYEENSQLKVLMIERQISVMLKKYLPELACISFKALKDGYSVSLSGQSDALHCFDFHSISYLQILIERYFLEA